MPLDVLGCTRATMVVSERVTLTRKGWVIAESQSCWGQTIVIISLERGIPSKCSSSDCADYVPALCTHRPSLLPIERSGELLRVISMLEGNL